MTSTNPLTLFIFIDLLTDAPQTAPITFDMGDDMGPVVMMSPMMGMTGDPEHPQMLTLTPVPAEPGETQSVADVLGLVSRYADRVGDAPVAIAPLGGRSRVVVDPVRTNNGAVTVATTPED